MKQCMSFIKGMGAGIIVGMVGAVALKCMCTKNKKIAKKTDKAARAVSDIMADLQEILG